MFFRNLAAQVVLRSNMCYVPLREKNVQSLRLLTERENAKIQELLVANEVLKLPIAFMSEPRLVDVVNMTDHAIRRLIKMAKKIAAFKALCQEDQVFSNFVFYIL